VNKPTKDLIAQHFCRLQSCFQDKLIAFDILGWAII
jgi:hypothetical protein